VLELYFTALNISDRTCTVLKVLADFEKYHFAYISFHFEKFKTRKEAQIFGIDNLFICFEEGGALGVLFENVIFIATRDQILKKLF